MPLKGDLFQKPLLLCLLLIFFFSFLAPECARAHGAPRARGGCSATPTPGCAPRVGAGAHATWAQAAARTLNAIARPRVTLSLR